MTSKPLHIGLGYRTAFESYFESKIPQPIQWLEVISENYFPTFDQKPASGIQKLLKLRKEVPVVLHGVSLSIASTDPLSLSYLKTLKDLSRQIEPAWMSDHLCWTGVNGENLHELFPVPFTQEAVRHVADRIDQVQNFLQRPFLFENVSSYVTFPESEMTEWEFISEVVRHSGCGLLFDINNVYVNAVNHRFDAKAFLRGIPHRAVRQIHLAGHSVSKASAQNSKNNLPNSKQYLIDTHDAPVCKEVWELYAWYTQNFGAHPTMIEWDAHFPKWETLQAELDQIQAIQNSNAKANHTRKGVRPHSKVRPSLGDAQGRDAQGRPESLVHA